MKKLVINLVCMLVPFAKARRKLRRKLLKQPQAEFRINCGIPPIYGKWQVFWSGCQQIVQKFRALPDPVGTWRDFCRNMDDESIRTACRVLAATDFIDANLSDILTRAEYDECMDNWKKLRTGVLKIADGAYAFGKYILPIPAFEYTTFINRHGIETLDLSKVPSDAVIADVGGFVGDSALVFSDVVKNKIYCFEPSAGNYELVKKTIELNGLGGRVVPVNLALMDTDAGVFGTNEVGSCGRVGDSGSAAMPTDTLDNFVEKHNLKVGIIKVDIEGAEQRFLLGAQKTIARDRPAMLLSIYHPWSDLDFFKVKQIIESWNLGYKFRIYKPMDYNMVLETLLICEA